MKLIMLTTTAVLTVFSLLLIAHIRDLKDYCTTHIAWVEDTRYTVEICGDPAGKAEILRYTPGFDGWSN